MTDTSKLIDEECYLVTYKAIDKMNGDEKHWNAWGKSEDSARKMIAKMVTLHKKEGQFSEFHYMLTLSKNSIIIHTETDAQ